jgi:hypothetical protein
MALDALLQDGYEYDIHIRLQLLKYTGKHSFFTQESMQREYLVKGKTACAIIFL